MKWIITATGSLAKRSRKSPKKTPVTKRDQNCNGYFPRLPSSTTAFDERQDIPSSSQRHERTISDYALSNWAILAISSGIRNGFNTTSSCKCQQTSVLTSNMITYHPTLFGF